MRWNLGLAHQGELLTFRGSVKADAHSLWRQKCGMRVTKGISLVVHIPGGPGILESKSLWRPSGCACCGVGLSWTMSVHVYGCNHVAIEVDDVEKAVAFYQDVFNLERLSEGEGDAFFKLGEHQFLAMFEVDEVKPKRLRHFGLMVRDEAQLAEARDKIVHKYGLELIPGFRCDFRDPFGNRIQVVDLHDESLVWLLPYQEVQKAGIRFGG